MNVWNSFINDWYLFLVGLHRKRWPWHTLGEGLEFSQGLVESFELGDNRLEVERRKA
ncbi:MAG TPA: hypothetical protein VFL31_06395 [Nitrospiraceae bacterium]|nr:hypothetical protein [Nitrospiraceae bacterium]